MIGVIGVIGVVGVIGAIGGVGGGTHVAHVDDEDYEKHPAVHLDHCSQIQYNMMTLGKNVTDLMNQTDWNWQRRLAEFHTLLHQPQ